ncbi:hypothetical protein DXA21_21645 [Parabacteroides distasonis]|nr:hypothetical protein DXA21_21645 [Parabacteroides distasonis]
MKWLWKKQQDVLNCKNKPCMSGCPVCVRIPEFIAQVDAYTGT